MTIKQKIFKLIKRPFCKHKFFQSELLMRGNMKVYFVICKKCDKKKEHVIYEGKAQQT
jgi:transcription elongation factor Elf1